MSKATINISMPDTMKSEVEQVVANDGYGNISEFFRDLFREYLKERQERKLEAILLESVESGDYTPLTKEDFEDIRNRGLKRIKDRVTQS